MINLENIEKFYSKKKVLGPLNLKINKGEAWLILGHNGAGKTTLLSIISNLTKPTSGSVKFENSKKKISFLFQNEDYIYTIPIRVIDVLSIGSNSKEKIENILFKFNLIDKKNNLFSSLSGGEKQLVKLALFWLLDREILFMDEPLKELDIFWQQKFMKFLKEFYLKGKTILYVSHQKDFLPDFFTNYLILKEGKVLDFGKWKDFNIDSYGQ